MSNEEKFSNKEIKDLNKLMKFCSEQERSEYDVRSKTKKMGISEDTSEKFINYLIENDFLNDKRFAELFVNSRIFNKKWGKIKVRNALYNKNITEELINETLNKIPEERYHQIFQEVLNKKYKEVGNKPNAKKKLFDFLMQRGFESKLIVEAIERL
ncbi:MAG: regulatory protein RecX [Flavobacteriales bacterium]